MEVTRDQLGTLTITERGDDCDLTIAEDFTSLDEYSRFKFGDGEVAKKYGTLLGELVLNHEVELLNQEKVLVACAAYRYAPPAAASLLEPFVQSASASAQNVGSETNFVPFKISKKKLATDNYAALSFEERSRTIQSDLLLPEGLELQDQTVIVLDDIRVTGLRQAALENMFNDAGSSAANFLYVLDTHEGRKFSRTEALINTSAVKSIDDIIGLANNPDFIPNVRMCKFIAAQTVAELERFCSHVPDSVVDTIISYIETENLRAVIKHTP